MTEDDALQTMNRHSADAERAIVLSVLESAHDSQRVERVLYSITPNDFYKEQWRIPFVCLLSFYEEKGQIPDVDALLSMLRECNASNDIHNCDAGFTPYMEMYDEGAIRRLYTDAAISCVSIHAETHAETMQKDKTIRDAAVMLASCYRGVAEQGNSEKGIEFIEQCQADLAELLGKRELAHTDGGLQPLALALTAPEILNPPLQLSTGLRAIDEALEGGLFCGALHYVVAGTSGFKSTLIRNLFVRMGGLGIRTALITLEDSLAESMRKCLSTISGESLFTVRRYGRSEMEGGPTIEQRHRIDEAREVLAQMPLMIDGQTADMERLTRIVKASGVQAALIDQSSWLQAGNPDSEYERARKVSRSLKQLAKNAGIAVVVAIQINREGAKLRDGEEPGLQHLRQCGEEDADIVAIIKRADVQDENGEYYNPGTLEIGIDKNRHGPRFTRFKLSVYPTRGLIDNYQPPSMYAAEAGE